MRKADGFERAKVAYLHKKKSQDLGTYKLSLCRGEEIRPKAGLLKLCEPMQRKTAKGSELSINLLASELIFKVFSYLDVKSLLSCASTCKKWEVIASNNIFWKRLYIRHVYAASKVGTEKAIKEPAAPLEVGDTYWKIRFIADAKKSRNKRFARLQKTSGYTGVTDHVKEVLEKLGAKFQVTLTTKGGSKFTFIERKRSVFVTSTLLQWYTLKNVPKLSEVIQFEIFSLTPIISQRDGSVLKSAPRSKALVFLENCHGVALRKRVVFCDDQIETFTTEFGLLLSVWKGTEDIAFIWAPIHHHGLIDKCLKSDSHEVYCKPHSVKPDDISRLYGLQGYKIHVQVCSNNDSVWDALYFTDTMNCIKNTSSVRFSSDNEFLGIGLESLHLLWKTDVFEGRMDNLVLFTVTVSDINADVLWHVSRIVKCENVKQAVANFDSASNSAIGLSHNDEVGRIGLIFHTIKDGGYALENISVVLNLSFVNAWFGTKH